MLGQCSHQFVWPRRATDGRYYQVCRICEVEYEYDWESMRRLQTGDLVSVDTASTDVERRDGELETTPAPEVVAFGVKGQPQRVPRLSLLLEREPAHRVFFRNLVDLVSARTPAPMATISTPAFFWNDVLVPSSMPWRRFVESLLGHMIVVTALLILFPKWPTSESIRQRSVFDKSYVSYYTPPKSFPALRSHPARVRAQSKRQFEPAHRPTIRMAPEHAPEYGQEQAEKPAMIPPPDLISSRPGRLKLPASPPAPVMPLSATGSSHLTVPAGPTWVVAPPSDSGLPTARRPGLLQAFAVAPAPEAVGVSSRRGIATTVSHAAVIAPPPSVSGAMRRLGDINIGESAVVKPAPQLPMSDQSTISAMAKGTLGGLGSSVVPPPPSVQSSGALPGGRASLLAGSGLQVVPPAPSVQGASNLAGGSRASAQSAAGLQVVPPTPSVAGAGSGAASSRAGALSVALQAVPPAPSMQGDGSGAGRGRVNSLSVAAGLQAMPPSARGAGWDGGDSAAAGGASRETGQAGSSSAADDPHEPATIEIPLRLIGPVLALPGSSYFSNYEVFIAERELGKGQSRLIKLVYVSLPYQQRLSEYGPSNWTVPKLRVTRDQSCDESLLQMTWPETDPRPDSQNPADSPALSSKDRTGMLPCYRTTADDYRRALSRSR